MIQIVCCSCTQRKLIAEGVPFYTKKRFYYNLDMVFVALCLRHPFFKERTGSRFENISCNCHNLQKGRCNNCKIICFNINFLADKIKLGHYLDVPSTMDIVPIEIYLEKMNSMFFFCFFLSRIFQDTIFTRSTEIYFLDEKKSPLD